MTEPSAKTFDLQAVLAGRGYPEKVVHVYFDEAAGQEIRDLNARLTTLSGLGLSDEYDKAEQELFDKMKSLNERRYEIHLKGVPRKIRADILKSALAKFPSKKDAFGRDEYDSGIDDEIARLTYQSRIVKIVSPDGDEKVPTEDDIQAILDLAPVADIKTIDSAINELDSAGEGFEQAARNTDFLSKPSAEG